jgi:single-strand DNA-binding protein
MFETNITIIGNLLTAPEWRRTTNSGRLVASFKVAAGTRRLERSTGQWVDGNGLRVRVTCWRELASGVASSLMVGDPVIVYGQIYTRDWVDAEGTKRTLYEMEALAVGHNLARGRARFARNKPVSASEIEPDPTEPVRLGGEPTEPAPEQPVGLAADDPLNALDEPSFGPYGFGYDDPAAPFDSTEFGTTAGVPDTEDGDDDQDDDDDEDDHVTDRRSTLAGV